MAEEGQHNSVRWLGGSEGENIDKLSCPFNGRHSFFEICDASNKGKNRTLFLLLKSVVLEVGLKNVVQMIIDNATTCVATGRDLERFPTLCWTPCAAHYIDLILEDTGKISWVSECVANAKKITKFIYNHS